MAKKKRWQDWENESNYEKIRRRSRSQPVITHPLFLEESEWNISPEQFRGRVVEVHKRYCFIAKEQSGHIDSRDVWLATIAKKFLTNDRSERNFVTVGDEVLCSPVQDNERVAREDLPQCVVNQAKPRKNRIYRSDPLRPNRIHILATNIDHLMVISSIINPPVKWGFIDRLLIIAEHEGIATTLVFNKFDLRDDNPEAFDAALEKIQIYENIGYQVFRVAVGFEGFQDSKDFRDLSNLMADRISLIAGQSGVGKSSFVNQYDPEIIQAVEEDDNIFYKGRHTTSFASFLKGSHGGFLIDTPGVKSFGIPYTEPTMLAYGFREFRPFVSQCQYRECAHIHEPICGVREAVEQKKIAEWRYRSYVGICSGHSGREGRAGTISD